MVYAQGMYGYSLSLRGGSFPKDSGPPPWSLSDLPPGVLVFSHELRDASTIGGVASGSRVSSWADAGPAADALTAAGTDRPVYRAAMKGGRPLLAGDLLDSEARFMVGAVSRTVTHVFAVAKHRKPNVNRDGSAAGPNTFDSVRGLVGLNGYDGLYPAGAASLILAGSGATNNFFNAYSYSSYRLDGTSLSTSAMDAGAARMAHLYEISRAGTFSGYPLVVGRDRNQATSVSRWRGDYRALGGFSNPSVGDLANLRAYYAWYTQGSIVACTGDSLTAGFGIFTYAAWPSLLDDVWQGTVDCPNFGIPGQGLTSSTSGVVTTMLGNDPAKLDGLPAGRTRAVLVVLAGTNDLAEGRTAAQVIADLQTYCAARRAAGWKVVLCTLLDRTDGSKGAGFDAKRATVNAWIVANWATIADALCDLAANANLGSNGVSGNTVYFSTDKVHLSTTGNSLVATLVQVVVETLLPA